MNSHDPSNGGCVSPMRIVTDGAHEIRSQLAVLLLELGKIDHPNARLLEADVQVTSETVNRIAILFKLATVDSLPLRTLDLADILRNSAQRAKLDNRNSHQILMLQPSGTKCPSEGHAMYLTEAIRGLIDNALRHTPTGTRVVIRLSAEHVVSIDDDGPGLPPSVVSRFGAPFVPGRVPTAGSGTGLALAGLVARLHGGKCYVVPSELGGTHICLSLARTASGQAAVYE